ncbi:hypothetical protein [Ectobacillus panaciterrae]|uniref:hypothetical protein n=1 Tax=Ectobacillus panaciterrae TaxID=363872 RepID=UPI0003FD683E|nr:hypothetical protein [Ectobacillus panaciterrae]
MDNFLNRFVDDICGFSIILHEEDSSTIVDIPCGEWRYPSSTKCFAPKDNFFK